MGQVNCCRPKTEKDLFIDDVSLSRGKFENVTEYSTRMTAREGTDQFQQDEGITQLEEKEVWMKNKDREEYYLGAWNNKEMTGQGVLYRPGKVAYYGQFEGIPHGKGKLVNYEHDLTYTGDIERGVIHGQGKVVHNKGLYEFEGNLEEGRPVSGWLTVYDPESKQMKYKAEIMDKPELKAIIDYDDQRHYEGKINTTTFLPEGAGIMHYQNKSSYDGNWKDGHFHGTGRFQWTNGTEYNGEYVDGVKHGQGKFTYASGKSYQGSWENGKQHGAGELSDGSGVVHQTGNWSQGNFQQSEVPA